MRSDRRDRAEQQIKLAGGPRALSAWVTATALADESGAPLGTILFFEDVTFLLRVERMEAWREVARRIAHEIKNPLTPIQLSAQRLRKRYAASLAGDEAALFDECTRTIIGQVEQLKRLVNEFSTFARLPAVEVAPHDLGRDWSRKRSCSSARRIATSPSSSMPPPICRPSTSTPTRSSAPDQPARQRRARLPGRRGRRAGRPSRWRVIRASTSCGSRWPTTASV